MTALADESSVAVIGMAGRFPGAPDLDRFWANLAGGVESITRPPASGGHQPACGILDGVDLFDGRFFGYAPREGLIMDPQHRLFLECAWTALEHAGYDPTGCPGAVGVYAGCSNNEYLDTLRQRRAEIGTVGDFQLRLATGMDFLTTRVAYKLGLRGPAVTVQTACSTSLVAIHVAVQALLAGECDMTLAGGVTAHLPAYFGEYTEDGVLAADGYCRAFDAKATGTVGGDGVGVVVLKRLEAALADGDTVHAVVRGSAVNNDGDDKIGYTAPSVSGQVSAMRTALAVAGVNPSDVSYVEAHGTGTPIGDPIEMTALTAALGANRAEPCWVGSVKTNIGHTDAAAGVAGFLKTVLALRHRRIPPSLHFTETNPKITTDALRVNTELRGWDAAPGVPRQAAVNSLGIGGTNAFVVLAEPPPLPATEQAPAWQLLPLSARTPTALASAGRALGEHLAGHPEQALADVAWTLQAGRRHHEHRTFAVLGEDRRFAAPGGGERVPPEPPRVVFAFPGQGAQRAGMVREIHAEHRVFREALDECAAAFSVHLGADLVELIHGGESRLVDEMDLAQAAVFSVEYALARLWRSWGVEPDLVVGHSLGAYAAACVAEVFTLDDAVALVAERARLLAELPPGGMTAVALPEADVRHRLTRRLDVAVVNAPDQCVVSGPPADLAALEAALRAEGVRVHRLRIPVAGHSPMIDAVSERFHRSVARLAPRPPRIPVVSDHTGTTLTREQAVDPAYWTAHLRGTVRFSSVLDTVLAGTDLVLLEVGPGHTATALARQHPRLSAGHRTVASLPHAEDDGSDLAHLLRAAGQLWLTGRDLDWRALHDGRRRRRVPLPTYPFEPLRYRIDPGVPVTIEPVAEQPAEADLADVSTTPTERVVAAAFGQVLGTPHPTPGHDFFSQGGDSLLASQLAARIRADLGVPLSVRDVFTARTVAALSELVDARLPQEGR